MPEFDPACSEHAGASRPCGNVTLEEGSAVYVSQPKAVAELIKKAAKSLSMK
jgi:hypothetical protein